MPVYQLGDLKPQFGRDVFVAPNATVIGDVVLGDEASVWFGAVLRGDVMSIRVGARSNIQDGSVVHVTGGKTSTTVGSDVTVGHMAILHGCTVEDGVLVGMGSIVLDGAVVGKESVIAAGALVPPGMIVPPRSMVMGRPGKVVRAVKESDLEWTREAAKLYVEYAHNFRTTLTAL